MATFNDAAFRTQAMLAPIQMEAGARRNEGIRYIGQAAAQIPEQMRRKAESDARIQMWQQEQALNAYKLQNLMALDEAGASRLQLSRQHEELRAIRLQNDMAEKSANAMDPQEEMRLRRLDVENRAFQYDPRMWRNPTTQRWEATPDDRLAEREAEIDRLRGRYRGTSETAKGQAETLKILNDQLLELAPTKENPTPSEEYLAVLEVRNAHIRKMRGGLPGGDQEQESAGVTYPGTPAWERAFAPDSAYGNAAPVQGPPPQQAHPWAEHPQLGVFAGQPPVVQQAAEEVATHYMQRLMGQDGISERMAPMMFAEVLKHPAKGPKAYAFLLKATGLATGDMPDEAIIAALRNSYPDLTEEGAKRVIELMHQDIAATFESARREMEKPPFRGELSNPLWNVDPTKGFPKGGGMSPDEMRKRVKGK